MTIPYTNLDSIYVDGTWHAPEGGTEAVVNPKTLLNSSLLTGDQLVAVE